MLCASLVPNINFLTRAPVYLNVHWHEGLDYTQWLQVVTYVSAARGVQIRRISGVYLSFWEVQLPYDF